MAYGTMRKTTEDGYIVELTTLHIERSSGNINLQPLEDLAEEVSEV